MWTARLLLCSCARLEPYVISALSGFNVKLRCVYLDTYIPFDEDVETISMSIGGSSLEIVSYNNDRRDDARPASSTNINDTARCLSLRSRNLLGHARPAVASQCACVVVNIIKNYQQPHPNRPLAPVYLTYERDGPGQIDGNYGADPNYVRSGTRPVTLSKRHQFPLHEIWQGSVTARSTNLTERDFKQPRELRKMMQQDGSSDQLLDKIRPVLAGVKEKLRKQVFGKYRSILFF